MKLLLTAINAKYIHSNLAVYSLREAAALPKANVAVAEYTINQPLDDILKQIYRQQPDVLFFSCYIWNIRMVEELAQLMHQVRPELPIWFGGPEVSYDAGERLLRQPWLTGILCQEGEATFKELARAYLQQGLKIDPAAIKGLYYRAADGVPVDTGARDPLDLDTLPFPYKDMDLSHKIVYYESSRGCPFSCGYCLSSIAHGVRFKSLDKVFEELNVFLNHKIPQVKFVDRTFNCHPDRTMAIWRFLIDRDQGVTNFHFEISADLIRDEALELLAQMRPGLVQLEIGVQSTHEPTLAAVSRRMDFRRLSYVVKTIKSVGNIHQHLDLIAGLPNEDYVRFGQSFDAVYALAPEQLQLGFLKILKGSAMEREQEYYGFKYHPQPPYEIMSTKWMSFEKMLRLKAIETMVEVYYNSGQFKMALRYLNHFFLSPFMLFEALGSFYEEQEYERIHSSRLMRYERLRAFIAARPEVDGDAFDQILTYDLYLREHMKTRPGWAKDLSLYKDEIADFYADHVMREIYFKGYTGVPYRQLRHDTHIEVFDIDVGRTASHGVTVHEIQMIRFDYRDCSSLEGDAGVLKVEDYNGEIRKKAESTKDS